MSLAIACRMRSSLLLAYLFLRRGPGRPASRESPVRSVCGAASDVISTAPYRRVDMGQALWVSAVRPSPATTRDPRLSAIGGARRHGHRASIATTWRTRRTARKARRLARSAQYQKPRLAREQPPSHFSSSYISSFISSARRLFRGFIAKRHPFLQFNMCSSCAA